ncbi:MAG TPA: S8 family serine peptidase, partial [Oscillatoriaceae cyanobacterium]
SDGALTTFPGAHGRHYGTFGGTSAAAPHVSGLAALVLSACPGLRPHEVKALLQKTADRLGGGEYHPEYGYGRINAFKAVTAAMAMRDRRLEAGA